MRFPAAPLVAAVVALGTLSAAADDSSRLPTPLGPNPEALKALAEVRRNYGADAAMMQAFLLGHAIQGGSVLEAAITVTGIEEHAQRKYLTFKLETGIVYNDRELGAEARLGRTWTRIVERSLRMFHSLTVPADGLGLVVTYNHKPYADEPDLRTHLSQGHGEPEAAVFHLLTGDIVELIAAQISSQQLADRAAVSVNGEPRRVHIEATEPTPTVESTR